MTALGGNMRGFKSHADVEVTFYANGLSIAGFPFHDYQTRQAKNILGDILDGDGDTAGTSERDRRWSSPDAGAVLLAHD